ncbi:unnamed protein product [Acanthocheilonema viteae]|uniref:DUF5641 domain-containing protein n=1 Tax=Acanthocheilonema viteae TaxID=6277 RepID=A0A498SPT2_ACAVI|nr:unnamed protein product [Acanthocheilonema viteae]
MSCKRWKAKPFKLPLMPNYPQERITKSRTFGRIGLDYLGPITVKIQLERAKRWITLFTCFTTRAVHLEIVDDLSTESFLTALKRFVARRGYPELILSDNSSQFQTVFQTIKTSSTQEALKTFWEIWKDEYLNSLKDRYQSEHKSPRNVEKRQPIEREVVLLDEPHVPRGIWKLARIKKLNVANDGYVRSAQIETPSGKLLNRSIEFVNLEILFFKLRNSDLNYIIFLHKKKGRDSREEPEGLLGRSGNSGGPKREQGVIRSRGEQGEAGDGGEPVPKRAVEADGR